MADFHSKIVLDSNTATQQVKKFTAELKRADSTLRKFQDSTKKSSQGGSANVFRKQSEGVRHLSASYIKLVKDANNLKKVENKLASSQKELTKLRKKNSNASDEQKEAAKGVVLALKQEVATYKTVISQVNKLNLKYDENAAAVLKIKLLRRDYQILVAAGLKTQKAANAEIRKEIANVRRSTTAYKEQAALKQKNVNISKAQISKLSEIRRKYKREYDIKLKVRQVTKDLNRLQRAGIITSKEKISLLNKETIAIKRQTNHVARLTSAQHSLAKAARLVSVFSRVLLGFYAVSASVRSSIGLEKTSEEIDLLNQKLTFLTGDSGAYKKLFDMTQDVGLKMQDANKIITRFAVVTNRAFSIETMNEWSATLVKSARATGTSTQEMTGALIQITQAMSAGRLMGDEYRSVTENLPLLTVALRDLFKDSTMSLKELSSEGLITNDVMIKAIGKLNELVSGFPDMTNTTESAINRLSSAWDDFVNTVVRTRAAKSAINELTDWVTGLKDLIKESNDEMDVAHKSSNTRAFLKIKELQKHWDYFYITQRKNSKDIGFGESGEITIRIDGKEQILSLRTLKKDLDAAESSARQAMIKSTGQTPANIRKQDAEALAEIERKRDATFKSQLKTLGLIDRITGGKSRLKVNKEATLLQNQIDEQLKLYKKSSELGISEEQHKKLSNNIEDKRVDELSKIKQKEINAILRSKGLKSKINTESIEEQLVFNDKRLQIEKKYRKIFENIEASRETKKAGGEGYSKEKAKEMQSVFESMKSKEIKDEIESVSLAIESIGVSADLTAAKLNGDISVAFGFDKANIVLAYEKAIEELDEKLKKLGLTTDELTAKRNESADALGRQRDAQQKALDDKHYGGLEKDFDKAAAATRQYDKSIKRLSESKTELNLSDKEYAYQLKIINELYREQTGLANALTGEMSEMEQVIEGMQVGIDRFARNTKTTFESIAELTESTADRMTDAIVEFAKTGKFSFRDFASTVIEEMMRIQARQLASSFLTSLFGLFMPGAGSVASGASFAGTGSAIFEPTGGLGFMGGAAKGAAFSGKGISAYSNQIISKPTVFPFANGIGLMGEKPGNDEAVMPLTRLSGGDLGVKSSGSGSIENNVIIKITINSDGDIESKDNSATESEGKAVGDMLGSLVTQKLIEEMRPGGLLSGRG